MFIEKSGWEIVIDIAMCSFCYCMGKKDANKDITDKQRNDEIELLKLKLAELERNKP